MKTVIILIAFLTIAFVFTLINQEQHIYPTCEEMNYTPSPCLPPYIKEINDNTNLVEIQLVKEILKEKT